MLTTWQKWLVTAKALGVAALVVGCMGMLFLPVQQALSIFP